ncbi:MAG: hypothetical protein C0392_15085 [Syntrophus sp. (in: bacteria)]|nr:hypothetical protein [Syntrophus sp. (in: bacteria)]
MGINAASFQSINIAERLSDLRLGSRGISFNGLRFRTTDFQRNGIDTPILLASAGNDLTGMLPKGMDQRWGFFAKGNAVTGTQKDTSEQQGYSFTNAGVTLGSDYRFTNHFIAGLMVGAAGSRASIDNMGSKVTMEGLSMGTYGTYYRNGFYTDGQLSYGQADYDNTRRIVFPGIDRTATSSPSGRQMTAYLGTGYEARLNQWMVTPNISLKYVNLTINSYTENGAGAIDLAVDRQTINSLQGTLGMKVSYGWQTEKALVIPNFRASWGYEFLKDTQNITASLAQGSSPFSTQTISPNRNFLSLGAGITAISRNDISFSLSYDAQIGESKYFACTVNAGVRVRF